MFTGWLSIGKFISGVKVRKLVLFTGFQTAANNLLKIISSSTDQVTGIIFLHRMQPWTQHWTTVVQLSMQLLFQQMWDLPSFQQKIWSSLMLTGLVSTISDNMRIWARDNHSCNHSSSNWVFCFSFLYTQSESTIYGGDPWVFPSHFWLATSSPWLLTPLWIQSPLKHVFWLLLPDYGIEKEEKSPMN